MNLYNNSVHILNKRFDVNNLETGLVDIDKENGFPVINIPTLNFDVIDSKLLLEQGSLYKVIEILLILNKSKLNKGGACIMFGTFDNLHLGHKIMMEVAIAISDEVLVGVEDKNTALARKHNKHGIMNNKSRIDYISNLYKINRKNVFIRKRAIDDIRTIINSGKKINTVLLGVSQVNENPEMKEVMDFCKKNNIDVVLIKRGKLLDNEGNNLSSTYLHTNKLVKEE